MSNPRLDIATLERDIANLLVQYPELECDDVLRADMYEGLGLHDVLADILDKEREAKAMVGALKERIDDLTARKARHERRQEAMRQVIQHLMERANLPKVTLPEATLSITHRKPSPIISDEAALPDECVEMVRKPVMATIKAWVDAGNMPDGVTMSNGSTSLTIRVK
jgi:hypothetical protein